MQEDQGRTHKRKYGDLLLELWEAIEEYSIQLRRDLQEGRMRNSAKENPSALAAHLVALWEQLYPYMVDSSLKVEFMSYADFADNPFMLVGDAQLMFQMKRTLRQALHQIGITDITRV